VSEDVGARDWKDGASWLVETVSVLLGVGINPGGEGIKVGPEVRVLSVVPGRAPFVQSHGADSMVRHEEGLPVDLSAPAPCLGVELEEEVSVAMRLGPAKSVEQAGGILRKDVGNSPRIPQDLGSGTGAGGRDGRGVLGSGIVIGSGDCAQQGCGATQGSAAQERPAMQGGVGDRRNSVRWFLAHDALRFDCCRRVDASCRSLVPNRWLERGLL
jgi:hypothetical protein